MTIYNDPEQYGLTIVGSAEVEPDYNFDMFVVWRNKEGRISLAMTRDALVRRRLKTSQ